MNNQDLQNQITDLALIVDDQAQRMTGLETYINRLEALVREQHVMIKRWNVWADNKFGTKATDAIKRVDPKWKSAAEVIEEKTGFDMFGRKIDHHTNKAVRAYVDECETETDRMIREIETGKVSMNDWVPTGEGIG